MRSTRNLAFVDVSGFTTYTEVEGDEAALEVLAAFRTLLRAIASRRTVRIAKWLGDGAMLIGLDTMSLISAVLEIEWHMVKSNAPLPIRSGVTKGEVLMLDGDDYVGRDVNLAARLCDIAHSHQTLIPTSLLSCAPTWAVASPAGNRAIRGFLTPISLTSLVLPENMHTWPTTSASDDSTPAWSPV